MTEPELAKQAGMCFYDLPQNLKPEQIDPLIRKAVFRINESGWVWTGESCQGHPDCAEELTPWGLNVDPFLRLICRKENLGKMFSLLVDSVRFIDKFGMDSVTQLRIYPCRKITTYVSKTIIDNDKWEEMMVYLDGTNVAERNRSIKCFEKFADLVNEGNTIPIAEEFDIRINSKEIHLTGMQEISYEEILSMSGYSPDRLITVVYCRGPENKPEGVLSFGQKVKLKNGMLFDAGDTSNA